MCTLLDPSVLCCISHRSNTPKKHTKLNKMYYVACSSVIDDWIIWLLLFGILPVAVPCFAHLTFWKKKKQKVQFWVFFLFVWNKKKHTKKNHTQALGTSQRKYKKTQTVFCVISFVLFATLPWKSKNQTFKTQIPQNKKKHTDNLMVDFFWMHVCACVCVCVCLSFQHYPIPIAFLLKKKKKKKTPCKHNKMPS